MKMEKKSPVHSPALYTLPSHPIVSVSPMGQVVASKDPFLFFPERRLVDLTTLLKNQL